LGVRNRERRRRREWEGREEVLWDGEWECSSHRIENQEKSTPAAAASRREWQSRPNSFCCTTSRSSTWIFDRRSISKWRGGRRSRRRDCSTDRARRRCPLSPSFFFFLFFLFWSSSSFFSPSQSTSLSTSPSCSPSSSCFFLLFCSLSFFFSFSGRESFRSLCPSVWFFLPSHRWYQHSCWSGYTSLR